MLPKLEEIKMLEILKEASVITLEDPAKARMRRQVRVDIDMLYTDTHNLSVLCGQLARRFEKNNIQAVVGLIGGGAILSHSVAEHLSLLLNLEPLNRVVSVYADIENGTPVLHRGYEKLVAGKSALVVDGLLNNSKQARELMYAVREAGGKVFGLGVIMSQGEHDRMSLEVPKFEDLVNVPVPEEIISWV